MIARSGSLLRHVLLATIVALQPAAIAIGEARAQESDQSDLGSPFDAITPAPRPDDFIARGEMRVAPASGELTRFSGVWHGFWEGTLSTYLVVLNGDSDTGMAKVFYSWGTNLLVSRSGHAILTAKLQEDTLIVGFESGVGNYRLIDDQTIYATYYSPALPRPSRAYLYRIEVEPAGD